MSNIKDTKKSLQNQRLTVRDADRLVTEIKIVKELFGRDAALRLAKEYTDKKRA